MPYDKLPHKPIIPLKPFEVSISQAEVDDLQNRLKNTRPFKRTFENSGKDEYFGVNLGWMEEALRIWKDEYDW
jgi:microsomal epoxide hydrolase